MNKKILITGASGYIGIRLIKQLLKEDCQIVALVRKAANLPDWLKENKQLEIIEGDLQDPIILKKAVADIGVLIHLAAVLRTFEKNHTLYQTNIVGLKNILLACQNNRKPVRFIFTSSVDAGLSRSDYAKSKIEGEKIVENFQHENPHINCFTVRIGHVYNETNGVTVGIKEIINRHSWQSAVLYNSLGSKIILPIEIGSLIKNFIQFIKKPELKNNPVTLSDEKLTVRDLINRFKKQNLIKRYPSKIPFSDTVLGIWCFIGKITKRADLLVYLSLQK